LEIVDSREREIFEKQQENQRAHERGKKIKQKLKAHAATTQGF